MFATPSRRTRCKPNVRHWKEPTVMHRTVGRCRRFAQRRPGRQGLRELHVQVFRNMGYSACFWLYSRCVTRHPFCSSLLYTQTQQTYIHTKLSHTHTRKDPLCSPLLCTHTHTHTKLSPAHPRNIARTYTCAHTYTKYVSMGCFQWLCCFRQKGCSLRNDIRFFARFDRIAWRPVQDVPLWLWPFHHLTLNT